MGTKKARSDIGQGKRKIVRRTVEVKKEIITKHENGACVSDLAAEYGMAKSTTGCQKSSRSIFKFNVIQKLQ